MLLDGSLQRGRVGADNLFDLLAALEEHEGGHGTHAQVGGHIAQLVDIDLVELGVGVLLAELGDLGGDGLAGTAPGGEAVEDDELLALLGGLPGVLTVEKVSVRLCSGSGSFSVGAFFWRGERNGRTHLPRVMTFPPAIVIGVDEKVLLLMKPAGLAVLVMKGCGCTKRAVAAALRLADVKPDVKILAVEEERDGRARREATVNSVSGVKGFKRRGRSDGVGGGGADWVL